MTGQSGQSLAGPHLEQDIFGILQQLPDAVGETDRLSDVAGPILRRLGFPVGDPAGGHIGDERNDRLSERHSAQKRGERFDDGVHHRRMEGVRRMKVPDRDAARFEQFFQGRDLVVRSRDDAQVRRIDRGEG